MGILTTAYAEETNIIEIEQLRQRITELEVLLEMERNKAPQQTVERLKILHEIDHAILSSHTPEDIAQAALDHLRRLIPFTRGSVVLFDFVELSFTVLAAHSQGETCYAMRTCGPIGDFGADFEVLRRGNIYIEANLHNPVIHSKVGQALLQEGIYTYINIPLIAQDELIGSLNIGADQPNTFDSQHIEVAREIASQIAIAIRQSQLTKESQRKNLELTGLYETAVATSGIFDLTELFNRLNEQIQRLFTPDTFMLALLDSEKDAYQLVFVMEQGEIVREWQDEFFPVNDGGLTSWVIQSRESLLANDLLHDLLPVEPIHGARPARSWLGVPLLSQNHLVGMISVQSFHPHAFDETHKRLLEILASQVAIAIENTRLFLETKENLLREQRLTGITYALSNSLDLSSVLANIVPMVAELIGADAGVIALVSPDGNSITYPYSYNLPDEIRPFSSPRGKGLAWSVIEEGSSRVVSDYQLIQGALDEWSPLGIQAMIVVPILSGSKCSGAFGLMRFTPNQPFTERDRQLLEAVGRVTGVTIHNVALFEGTRRNVNRLTALRKIDIAITTSMDLEEILNILLEQVTDQLQVDAADVLLLDAQTQTLRFSAGRGFKTSALQHTNLKLGLGYAGQVALRKSIVEVPDLKKVNADLNRSLLLPAEKFVSYFGVPLLSKGQVVGVLEIFHRSLLMPNQEWLDYLEALAGQTAIAIDNASLFQRLDCANQELSEAYNTTLEGWAKALELRDIETQGHSQRVTDMTLRLAQKLCISANDQIYIRYGALLHDIGKMGIPDKILHKTGELTEEEWKIMRMHPVYAYEMLSPIAFLQPALDIPYAHHEKWDGSGYPAGLSGENIPLSARIFAVVDVWDALRSDRPYRSAWPEEQVLEYLKNQSGKHFDPRIVEAFLDLLLKN